jgi:hypothetical protein
VLVASNVPFTGVAGPDTCVWWRNAP